MCTNNPNASNTNIYYATVTITNGVGATTQFKFGYVNGNYENNPTHTYPGNPSVVVVNQNREFLMPNVNGANLTLPTVYFNDTINLLRAAGPARHQFRDLQCQHDQCGGHGFARVQSQHGQCLSERFGCDQYAVGSLPV